MIKIETCRGCGRILYSDTVGGVAIRTETTPLDGPGATRALLGGTDLWAVRLTDGRPSTFMAPTPAMLGGLNGGPAGAPTVVAGHRCPNRGQEAVQAAVSRPPAPSPDRETSPAPKARVAPSWTPSSAPSAEPSPAPAAPAADRPRFKRSRTAPCDECGKPVVIDGPVQYAAIELGATVVWAQHAACG